jgi:hypothetical protein
MPDPIEGLRHVEEDSRTILFTLKGGWQVSFKALFL